MKCTLALLLFVGLAACKSVNSSLSFEEQLLPGGQLTCENEAPNGPERRFYTYAKNHIEILADANPEIFQDALDEDNFCVKTNAENEIAAGTALDGRIYLNTGLLRAAETDAQFAAVIAHELSHIVLRHGARNIMEFADTHPEHQAEYLQLQLDRQEIKRFDKIRVAPEREWKTYLDNLRSLVKRKWGAAQSSGNLVALNGMECEGIANWVKPDELRKDIQKRLPAKDYEASLCQQFFKEFSLDYKEAQLLTTWKEIEADRHAFANFIKAGYPEDEYAQFFANASQLRPARRCVSVDADDSTDCWRGGSIRNELKSYSKASTFNKPLVLHNFGSELAELREYWANAGATNTSLSY